MPMRKGPHGRWTPYTPKPKPDPPMAAPSYDVFLVHRYTHNEKAADDCPFCQEPRVLPDPPWELIRAARLS